MPAKKLLSAIFLFVFAIASIGLPLLTRQALTRPRLARDVEAWLLGAEYLGEEGVIRQRTAYDCGIVCLQMALRARGIGATQEALREIARTTEAGTSMLGLKRAAEAYGVTVSAWRLASQDLPKIPLPAIAFVEGNHFVVIESVARDGHVQVLDPARGRLRYPNKAFNERWRGQTLLFGEHLP
jgi:ABC-type bacteriocin/lantibiotic exporter with double-glycine peptidase domain